MTTTLYRYFDSKSKLLYVGITKNQLNRFSTHSKEAPWFAEIATATFEQFISREKALEAETDAIGNEFPRFNKAGPTIKPELVRHMNRIVSGNHELPGDYWHEAITERLSLLMDSVNEFSQASEAYKLAFALGRSYERDQGESGIQLPCTYCQMITESKWYQYVFDKADSMICDEAVSR